MEEVLEKAFTSTDPRFAALVQTTLDELMSSAQKRVSDLGPLVKGSLILQVVLDSRFFTSMDRYKAIRRLAKLLPNKPVQALQILRTYDADIIKSRNTLAHAKEEAGPDGTVYLRSMKKGQLPVVIDDAWMVDFRGKLRSQHTALLEVCRALTSHVDEGTS